MVDAGKTSKGKKSQFSNDSVEDTELELTIYENAVPVDNSNPDRETSLNLKRVSSSSEEMDFNNESN